jgi:AbiJ N-terminal domain 4
MPEHKSSLGGHFPAKLFRNAPSPQLTPKSTRPVELAQGKKRLRLGLTFECPISQVQSWEVAIGIPMKKLFTERHGGAVPRVKEELDEVTRNGILELVRARIDEEWFGDSFPSMCPDGRGNGGCDKSKLETMMKAYGVIWPDDMRNYRHTGEGGSAASDGQVFDLIEFSYEQVSEPTAHDFHSYYGHSHYSYNQELGRRKFEQEVNRIFERNGMAFQLEHGEVTRLAPMVLQEALRGTTFRTGDEILDGLLENARNRFLNRSLDVRREALEKLWDAWERLKTVEPGADKKASAKALLARTSAEPAFRVMIEREAIELTAVGNGFMIRHTEVGKVPIVNSSHVDYLFGRMFSLVLLALKSSGRAT